MNVVNSATAEVLATCPQVDVVEHDAFPYAAVRYYAIFGFGRAAASGEYKMVHVVNDRTCEILTLGDDNVQKVHNDDTLLCFDLEREQWRSDVLQGPRKFFEAKMWRSTLVIHIAQLNGADEG
jgi:hypothetical protein